ncbi:prolyl 4-hydroxylase subunit alpha [Muricauda sp. TY007]|uniref:2OG-Fe(II) oxygenase n=1 Tax=Allomuricauda sp. TY007 TaxID=2683200 RepID=UPI0013C0C165|nr:2OG-Fe(II) oxygenase [Muricauda sp. TY007]NDV16006.1 prolyl 4-hydroxylase subunit alpha [Muricauda sp. TY007]
MNNITSQGFKVKWDEVEENLHSKGYAVVPGFLEPNICNDLKELYDQKERYRKTVIMERYRFGLGAYKYFDYPLPKMIQNLRSELYPHLIPIANLWMKALKIEKTFPETHQELIAQCKEQNQLKPTPLILKYGKGGFNTLHQDLYGEVYFPIQAVLFLSDPNIDYEGGEFVMTQQTPRAQSKAIVLRPQKGDMLLFTTNFRPVKGKKGYYRVNMKHGVSELHHGERYTLGIIFHDAIS